MQLEGGDLGGVVDSKLLCGGTAQGQTGDVGASDSQVVEQGRRVVPRTALE